MKKLLPLLLALLVLTGCAEHPVETIPTQPPETSVPTEPTEPSQSFYVADTPMERGTAGAVRVYAMEDTVTGIARLGDSLLICTENRQICLLDPETLSVTAQRELECEVEWGCGDLVITGNHLAYYDTGAGSYIVLDDDLLTVSAVELGDDLSAHPVVASTLETIYYANAEGIQVLNLSTGGSRLLRQEHETVVNLDGVYFNDTLLRYTRRLSDGTEQDCFISAENGRLYDTAAFQEHLVTWDDRYATVLEQEYPFGKLQYLLSGQWDGEDRILSLPGGWDSVSFPGSGLALIQQKHSVGLVVSCYDLETGTMISQVTMPQIYECFAYSFADGDRIWLWNGTGGGFYCWDRTQTAVTSGSSLLDDYRVLTDDDADASYVLKARTLSEQYQVKITLTDGQNRTQGLDYSDYPDYRETYYSTALDLLEDVLEQFPQGFLKTMAKKTSSGYLQIRLTDDYDPATGVMSESCECDLTGKEITISISMCESMEELFIPQLYAAIETRIRNRCDDLDKWWKLNPEEFEYGNAAVFGQYAEGSSRYFLDADSMDSAREDRARIFQAAMAPGNEELFQSEHLQAKLSELCRLIRKAYSLDADMELPWEQYLDT